jgi:hypothetical protein
MNGQHGEVRSHLLSQTSQMKQFEQAYIDMVAGLHLMSTPTLRCQRKVLGGTKQGGFNRIAYAFKFLENPP